MGVRRCRGMIRPAAKSMSALLRELHTCVEEQERELRALQVELVLLRCEREELLEQLRFATDLANRETRTAASLRAQLLARTSVANERVDFCCGAGGETTAVLPRPRLLQRRRAGEDDTER